MKFTGIGCKSLIWLTASSISYMVKYLHIPHISGSSSTYLILHPIPSEFPYIRGNFVFFFISWLFQGPTLWLEPGQLDGPRRGLSPHLPNRSHPGLLNNRKNCLKISIN
jgi:hypothetical protein